jgi:hypothetical protein
VFDYREIKNVEIEGIDFRDAPDFCDAFITYAEYFGKELNEDELETLNQDSQFVYEQVLKRIY